MNLRKHQSEFKNLISCLKTGNEPTKIILHVTPGGGKSCIPIIAGKLVAARKADALCWITPRKALQDQGERNFLDPYFRKILNHSLMIRSSTNETNPCRGQNGFVTTYQAVAMDNRTIIEDFRRRRYVLILDEFHHVELDGVWHQHLKPLIEKAKYLVLMTGTLERGDENQIAFIDYRRRGNNAYIPSVPDIRYTRSDALSEKAIIPLRFILSDGQVEWETKKGEKKSGDLSNLYEDQGAALFTALNTEFAEQLLAEGLKYWILYKERHPRSKLLIVTANYDHAKKFKGLLGYGLSKTSDIATSHDTPNAMKAIKAFKEGSIDILVTIAMAYEGLDVPAITHVICLTHIRSTPWIEQMIARAVRIDPHAGPYESQKGHIFAPDDFLFRGVVNRIKAEQIPVAHQGSSFKKNDIDKEIQGEKDPDIIPLGGQITGRREVEFGTGGLNSPGEPEFSPPVKTVKELEEEVLEQINNHIKEFSFANYYKPQQLNAELKQQFGKSRREMTLSELKGCLSFVQYNYPLAKSTNGSVIEKKQGISPQRGKGRRVPTQATIWEPLKEEENNHEDR